MIISSDFLQFLLVVNFGMIAWKRRLMKRRRLGLALTHAAFIIILLGALVSHLFGEEGTLHLREGERGDRIVIQTAGHATYHTLPFTVELIRFTLTRYPGSASPSSYESELLVHVDGETRRARVYMNNVLDVKGYRFFQASYDPDERGTILSVNRDVAGRNITYTGYLMLGIGLVCTLLGKNSRFGQLRRRLREAYGSARLMLLSFFLLIPAMSALAREKDGSSGTRMREVVLSNVVSPEHAARFGSLPVQSPNGRMSPINTFSSEVLRKLHKSDRYGSLNSDQFLLSLLALPEMWVRVPLIAISNKELAAYYDLGEEECAYIEFFDRDGRYKLQAGLEEAYNKMPVERTRFDKDLIKLDEQVNIFHLLINYQMLNIFPKEDDPNHKWYAPGDDLSVFTGKDSLFVSRIMGWYLSEVQAGLKSGPLKRCGRS